MDFADITIFVIMVRLYTDQSILLKGGKKPKCVISNSPQKKMKHLDVFLKREKGDKQNKIFQCDKNTAKRYH